MITLTDEQVLAATAPERLVNIVSAPGSGKTTVAAERFGFQRYQSGRARGVLGLSFTRAAVSELSNRIAGRWGSTCLEFPHRVMTFDSLHCLLLERLLSEGFIQWPGGHTSLDVRDDYRGFPGYRWLQAGNYRRAAVPGAGAQVVSTGVRVTTPTSGIGKREDHDALLNAGIVSHDDVRNVLLAALKESSLREYVTVWLVKTFRSIVIDEVYDAALLDLSIAYIAAESGLSVTVIGDPRQALYGWRGARPDLVEKLLRAPREAFAEYQLTTSFRFAGPQMPALSESLRGGDPVTLPTIDCRKVDVALARRWRSLWAGGENILPLAFRNINNATDAALSLLLDVVTRGHLGRNGYGREAAMTQLRLDDVDESERDSALRPVLAGLVDGATPADVLHALRDAIASLGSRRPNKLKPNAEAARVEELGWLATRLHHGDLVPGLTVHQAKGGEWPRVGVVLADQERRLLAAGLRELEDDDCVIYVALTRAKQRCGLLTGYLTLDLDADDAATS